LIFLRSFWGFALRASLSARNWGNMKSFGSYAETRQKLAEQCDVVEAAWTSATTASEFEQIAGGNTQDAEASASEVADLIAQARLRLRSDTIEVGIFGEVKRGKSTLINALVGKVVSSMRVTPETAIPVWVESGPGETRAIFSDGSSQVVADTHEAQEMASQRRTRSNGVQSRVRRGRHRVAEESLEVVRIIQFVDLSWLPEGLRLVDTPGLQDPSLVDSYEQRTMSELERVSAAIFMFVQPPGPASHEVQVLRNLARQGIDKVFLVVNFYSDVWNNSADKEDVLQYIQDVVVEAAVSSSAVAPKDIKLYAINAKMGLNAILNANDLDYRESGVEALRNELEDYLVNGALKAVTLAATERLQLATGIIKSTLDQREAILRDPSRLDGARRDLNEAVTRSERELEEIERRLVSEGEKLGMSLGETLSSPYEITLRAAAGASTPNELKAICEGLKNLVSGALTKAATDFERTTGKAISEAERKLLASFGAADSFAAAVGQQVNFDPGLGTLSVGGVTSRIDWSQVASTGMIAGAGAAIAGGTLAGGAGLALLASGPVGWAVGAVALGVVGLLGGTIAGLFGSMNKINDGDRRRITSDLTRMMSEARDFGKSAGSSWGGSCAEQLRSQRQRYLGDKLRELEHVTRVLQDSGTRDVALREISRTRDRLSEIV
jgi:GTPase SAR1 family protein